MKKHFVLLMLVLISLITVCPYVGMVNASSNKVLKGIDFSKPLSEKEQKRVMSYYYKHSQEACKQINKEPNVQAKGSIKRGKKSVGTYGDILYAYEFCVTILCGSIIGHVGIVSTDEGWTVESYPKRGARMQHLLGKQKREDGVRLYPNRWRLNKKVLGLRVRTAKKRHYMGAAKYAMKQAKLKKPYNKNIFDKHTEAKFYCSQLVWKAWKKQGYKLELINLGKYDPILPVELYWSPWTYVFYKK